MSRGKRTTAQFAGTTLCSQEALGSLEQLGRIRDAMRTYAESRERPEQWVLGDRQAFYRTQLRLLSSIVELCGETLAYGWPRLTARSQALERAHHETMREFWDERHLEEELWLKQARRISRQIGHIRRQREGDRKQASEALRLHREACALAGMSPI